jgi:hypothetical protein
VSTIASQYFAPRARRDIQAERGVTGVRDLLEKPPASGAGLRGAAPGAAQQAAVLHLGSEALHLARSAQPEAGLPASAADEASPGEVSESQNDPQAPQALAPAQEAPAAGEAAEAGKAGKAGEKDSEPSEEEAEQIRELEKRDREVRTHEQAHKAAGGSYAGSIHLGYSTGPDGKRYASSGSVSIDVSPVKGDPEATLRKMQVVQRAATAPADPSGADRQVASRAASTASQARAELAAKRYAEAKQQSPA